MIWGHARTAPYGQDVVCAGVSAVATTALIGLTERFPEHVRYRILPQGLIQCRVSDGLTEDEAKVAHIILDTMVLGLEAIRQTYKDVIDLIYCY